MKIFLINLMLLSLMSSCWYTKESKNDLVLEILNDTLIAFPYDMEKDAINVINYSIQNNLNSIYYFNQGIGDDFLSKKVYKNGIFISLYEITNNKEVVYSDKLPFEHQNRSDCDLYCSFIQSIRLAKDSERLKENIKGGYYHTKDERHYFFIHPKEKIFFKQYINLTDSMRYEDTRINYAHLKKNVRYSSKFFIPSDSTDFKKELPTNVLKTIEANNVKVYHGVIESKNIIPVKVID